MKAVIYEQPGVISPTKAAELARLIVGYAQAHPEILEKENDHGGHDNKSEEKVHLLPARVEGCGTQKERTERAAER